MISWSLNVTSILHRYYLLYHYDPVVSAVVLRSLPMMVKISFHNMMGTGSYFRWWWYFIWIDGINEIDRGLTGSKGAPSSRGSNKWEDWSGCYSQWRGWSDGIGSLSIYFKNARQLIFAWGLNIRLNIHWLPENSFFYSLTMLQYLPTDSSFMPEDLQFYLRCIIFMKKFIMHIFRCTILMDIHYLCLRIYYSSLIIHYSIDDTLFA